MAGFGIGGNADFGRIAQEEGVPANLLPLAESIYQQETHSGQNVATSPRGAVGPMQVTPATFQDYHPNGDIHNPADNIRAGLRKIKSDSEFFNGDPSLTAAAYHAGRQAVVNAGNAVPDTNDGSISTADYADAVTQRLPTQPQPLPEPAKPPTWDEVRNDPRLKDAAPEVIEGARKQYFNRLILPKLQPDEIDGAWKRFDELTNPSMTASAKRTIGNAMDATTGAVSSAAKATYGAAGDAAKGVGMAITDAAKKVGGGNAVQARENPVTPEDVSIDEGGYHAPADMTARTEVKIPGSVMTVPTIEVAPHVDQRAMDAGLGPIDTDAMNLRVRRTLEAATPEEREAFAQRPDYIGQLAKDQLASWQKHDVQAAQLPALQGMTERWEDRAAQLQKQGMSKVDAEREAKAQATLAIPPHSEGSITPSDLDFEGQKGAKRVWNDWQSGMVGTTGGILSYVARKSGMGSAEDIGDAMSHWAEKKMPAEPTFSDKMVSNIAGMTNFYLGGVGVRTGTEALSMLGPVLAKWAGAAGDAGLMAASSANEVYHGALGQGLSEKEAAARADKAFAANALFFTGANRLGFFNDLTKLGEKVTAAAATNAPLMATQQVIQNYFLDRPLDEGVGEAALMGATAGAAVVGAHHLAGKLPVPAEKPAPVHIEPGLATEPAVGGKAEPAMGNVEVAASNEPAMGATPEVKGAKEPVLGAEPTLTESTKTPAIAKYEPVAGEPPPWEIPRKAFYADKQRPITTPMPLYATADPHKFLVEQALESGEPVPKDVLADYPALAAKYPQKEEPVATEPKKQSSETPETPEIVKPEPVTASRLEALAQAGKLSRSTGTPHEVIQNPNEPGKWLVQPKEDDTTRPANEAGDAKQAPAFSRNRGVPVEDLNAIVQGIRARWKGAPRIHPLFEHDEAPQSLQDEIAKSGGPRDHAGAFHNGEIYLFGKYMADDAHGQRVAVHELTHYGLEGLLGDDLGPVMMRIWKDHPGVQLEASRLMNRYHYSRVTAVNEVLANMGGKGERPSWWQKLTAAVRDSLRRYGFNLKMNDADVTSLVDRALQYSRKPKSDVTHLYRTHYSQPNPVWYSQMGRQIADKGSTAIPAELKAREEAAKKAEAEKAKEPPGKKVTADQVDLFNPQGSLFSRAETPDEKLAKEYARAKAAEPTEPMPRGKLAREYTLTKDAHKAGALFSRADALGEVEAQSKDNWLKAHYLKAAKSVINFTDRLANPLVDLPGERDYLKHRQVAMGVIGSGNDVVKEIRNVFHEATPEDRQAAFDYFTTEGASPASIKDEKVRSGVQTIKDAINHVSDQLVDKGVINAESREEFRDRYLPQLYLRHLLEDNAWKIGGSGKKTSDMGYTKGRKLEQFRNAEGEVRLRDKATGKELSDQEVLKLGPVTDPEYLASVALARPMRDMAILDWLESISKDERWVLPNTTMKWNGKNVSPYFLKTEADRLRRQANYYEPEAGKRATGYADKMDAAANKALENLPTDSKGFTQIPNSGRYGAMRGIWVRSEVYHDLVGNAHFQPNDMNWFQNLFGVGGVGTKVTQMWKGTKTYLNPSGQVRNFVTNMTQLQLSGVPFHSLPSLMIKTIGEMRNKGPHFQEFKAQGGETGTFANEDLGRMQRELLDMQHRDGELSTWGQLHRAAAIVTNKAGDVWQANEVLGKLMKFIHERERGASPGNAMIEANKTLFDYSLVQPWIRYARSVPYGIPFATWNAKVLPRLTETALLHPQRYLPYVAAFYGAQYALASVLGVTYDDLDKLRKAMPQWLWDHHNAMLMPWKDAKGRWQVMDLSYFMPWQQWGQLANDTVHGDVSKSLQDIGAFGGPIPNIISAISTQQDPFTHRDIAHKGDPPMQQAASWLNYAWTLAAPPFLTDSGALGHAIRAYTGTTNKYGDPLDTPTQSLLRPFGINLYALTPEQTQMANVQRMKHDVNDSERELKTQLLDRSLSPEQRDTIRNRYLDEIQRREGKINQYLEDSKIAPALRTGH